MPFLHSRQEKYRILPLPQNPDTPGFEIIVAKYRALRLLALKTSYQFWSDYEIERQFTDKQWIAKLTREDARVFVCVKMPDKSLTTELIKSSTSTPSALPLATWPSTPTEQKVGDEGREKGVETEQLLLSQEFAGTLTIIGPIPGEEYEILMARKEEKREARECGGDLETRWQIGNLFTHPSHRRQGIALMLGAAAYEYARNSTVQLLRHPVPEPDLGFCVVESGQKDMDQIRFGKVAPGKQNVRALVRVRCMVKQTPTSGKLIALYKSCQGMKELERRCTLKEVFEAVGDGGLVPMGWEGMDKWNTRDLTVLEDVVVIGEGPKVDDRAKEGRLLACGSIGGIEVIVRRL